jgi:quinoprotein glucose dehydrogenase
VRNGKGEMPPFTEKTLPSAQLDMLAAYLTNPSAGDWKDTATAPTAASGRSLRYYGPFGTILFANNGLMAINPPWSQLVAYDLNEGTIKWQVPLGTTPGLAAKGIKGTGSSALVRNGPVVTAGGLIFVGSGPDRFIHAYDKDTGALLWETELDANPDGIPAVYQAGGREFVAFFAASGEHKETLAFKPGDPAAQGYYVFALSKTDAVATKER